MMATAPYFEEERSEMIEKTSSFFVSGTARISSWDSKQSEYVKYHSKMTYLEDTSRSRLASAG